MLKAISITQVQKGGAKTLENIQDYAVVTRGEEELGMILNKNIAEYLLEEGILDQICEELYELQQKDLVKDIHSARERKYTKDTTEFKLSDYTK